MTEHIRRAIAHSDKKYAIHCLKTLLDKVDIVILLLCYTGLNNLNINQPHNIVMMAKRN